MVLFVCRGMLFKFISSDLIGLVTKYVDKIKWHISMQAVVQDYHREFKPLLTTGENWPVVNTKPTVYNYRMLSMYGTHPIDVFKCSRPVATVLRYAWSSIVLKKNLHFNLTALINNR